MTFPEYLQLMDNLIAQLPTDFSPQVVIQLQALLPDTLILAALDLLDRLQVVKYMCPGVAPQYRVLGSTAIYTVFPNVGDVVLMAETHSMCKHILAVRLAHHFSMFAERPCTLDEISSVSAEQEVF